MSVNRARSCSCWAAVSVARRRARAVLDLRILPGLWRFWVSDRAAFACMKLALSAFEADRTHCSGEHGGSVDADREAWVPGKGVPLGALQGGSPGECLFHQIRGDRHDDAGGHREAFGL